MASKWRPGFAGRSTAGRPLLIAISGYGEDQVRERVKEAGFDHHLVKPVDFDALLTLLDRADAVAR